MKSGRKRLRASEITPRGASRSLSKKTKIFKTTPAKNSAACAARSIEQAADRFVAVNALNCLPKQGGDAEDFDLGHDLFGS